MSFHIGQHVYLDQFEGRPGIVREVVPPHAWPRTFAPANNRVTRPVTSYVVTVLAPKTVTVCAGAGIPRQLRKSFGCVRLWPDPADLSISPRVA